MVRDGEQSPEGERREQPSERAGQRDAGEVFARDAHAVPAHVSAEAGDEHREVDLEAAAAGSDEVSQLVDGDAQREARGELPAEDQPVEPEEADDAEEKLQLENDEEERLRLEQEEGNRS